MTLYGWKYHVRDVRITGRPTYNPAFLCFIVLYTDPADSPELASAVAAVRVRPDFPPMSALCLAEQIIQDPSLIRRHIDITDLRDEQALTPVRLLRILNQKRGGATRREPQT
jgi:hypothetical protein